ncbi:unnamed protein product [Ciceribacter sp. T2.26MG-112.2]|nr:unnamed protein product [Ciceribacter naphthalenivorans]
MRIVSTLITTVSPSITRIVAAETACADASVIKNPAAAKIVFIHRPLARTSSDPWF